RRSAPGSIRTVAIYTDPGRTSMLVRRLLDEPAESWRRDSDVVHQQILLPLTSDGSLDLDAVQRWVREDESDVAVVVTEIPRVGSEGPKSVELEFDRGLAVISLPVLGPVAVKRSLRRDLDRAVESLEHDSVDQARARGGLPCRVEQDREDGSVYVTPKVTSLGRIWTTLGVTASNEPLWSLARLSGVFAAASATGAFGIFYNAIWDMANTISPLRLGSVTVAAITIVMAWLILSNRLWERPGRVGGRRLAIIYNASTVLSLLISITVLYATLFLAILGLSLVLIDPEFMGENVDVDHAGEFVSYLRIAWLAASLGTVAGAIGSNFDSDDAIRKLTQGSRELDRYPRDEEQG
ncbi:MAG: hypothetical protein Q4F53_08065, partial [Nesterenkonia sp.]|nr:hypothetical protein [Nesterenkonia sp.]